MRPGLALALAALVCGTLVACVSQGDIDALEASQKELTARVERLERARVQPPMPPAQRGPDADKVYALPVGTSAVLGRADAWVTLVEISDFQCPFCSRAAATVKEVVDKYKDDVRVVFKHNPLPFHPRALPAALAAECAGKQGKFWPVADGMFADQSKLSDEDLLALAKRQGVREAEFQACLKDAGVRDAIGHDQALAVRMGARGTPAFFINGRFLSGAQPLANFAALIDEELKKAKASGIARGNYYAQVVEQKGLGAL